MDRATQRGLYCPLPGRVLSRFISSAAILIAGCWLFVSGLNAAPPPTSIAGSIGKGPVGWDSYRRLDLLPSLLSGVESRELSSTDPAQANGDFFHEFRRTSDGQYVIAEANGPGEIVSIWSTINGGDVTADGVITIQLDGQTVVSANYAFRGERSGADSE